MINCFGFSLIYFGFGFYIEKNALLNSICVYGLTVEYSQSFRRVSMMHPAINKPHTTEKRCKHQYQAGLGTRYLHVYHRLNF